MSKSQNQGYPSDQPENEPMKTQSENKQIHDYFLLWEDVISFLNQSQKQCWVKPKEILDFFWHSIENALSYNEDNLLKQIFKANF